MTIPLRHQIVARLKRQDRIGPDGTIISPLFVAELDPLGVDDSGNTFITDRDGFDLTVVADERYVAVGFWYNDANTPPSFDADNFPPIEAPATPQSLDELQAQIDQQDAVIAQLIEGNARLRAGIDAIKGG